MNRNQMIPVRFPRHTTIHLALVLASLPASGPAAAQTGAIMGIVQHDQQPVGGAGVDLLAAGEVVRRMVTDSAGGFLFAGLAPDTYDVAVSQLGFAPGRERNVRVAAGETRFVRIVLTAAPVELTAVEAVGTGVRIDTRSTEFATTIREEQIRLLPLGRDPKSIIALTPGARENHVWGGATAQANNYQIDGLAANHPGAGGDLVQLSMSWIDRVEVRGLGAGAEHGNFQGGLINVVTKSGSNDRVSSFRSTMESHHLNASNIESTEIGVEVQDRFDIEGDARGPILRDRLFYYIAGQYIRQDLRWVNHLAGDDRYSPVLEREREARIFGKLTWQAGARSLLEASLIRVDDRGDHAENTGYEAAEATVRRRSATSLYNLQARHAWRGGSSLEAKVAHIALDGTRSPYTGPDVPGVQTYAQLPPYAAFRNAPIRFRHAPATTTGTVTGTLRWLLGGQEHALKVGVEHSAGTHRDERLRNGGLTWRPPRRPTLDPERPSTWMTGASAPFVPLTIGGEVDLRAAVQNSAAFAQATLGIGPVVRINPGIRYGRWIGRLTPGGGAGPEFTAVEDAAWEPRLGAILDFSRDGSFVLKGHWGRYHQSMIAQFFDRVEGGNVFSNEETWHYRGPVFTDPGTTFDATTRQQLIDDGLLSLERAIRLNETGRVENYRQPYVDQWLVGLERSFGTSVKLEGLYIDRRNRRMVSLVDRNAATNYTRFERVRVLDIDGVPIPFEGGTVQLRELYIPNNRIVEMLRLVALGECHGACLPVPGFSPADTLNLSWNPDYVLTNVPDARREFNQFQFSVLVSRPTWGAHASVVLTDLFGNLDTVTGYDDPAGYGAGPYVRVNEGVNSFGRLPNHSKREIKVSVYGDVGWRTQAGAFWTFATGDHFAPHFIVTGDGFYRYSLYDTRQGLAYTLLEDLEGHRIFLGPRGAPRHETRGMLDLRLERDILTRGGRWTVTLEAFNIVNMSTVTKVNTAANRGRNYYWFLGPQRDGLFRVIDPNEYYKAVLERVPPRTIRLSTAIRF